jgi:hypothetical protein
MHFASQMSSEGKPPPDGMQTGDLVQVKLMPLHRKTYFPGKVQGRVIFGGCIISVPAMPTWQGHSPAGVMLSKVTVAVLSARAMSLWCSKPLPTNEQPLSIPVDPLPKYNAPPAPGLSSPSDRLSENVQLVSVALPPSLMKIAPPDPGADAEFPPAISPENVQLVSVALPPLPMKIAPPLTA